MSRFQLAGYQFYWAKWSWPTYRREIDTDYGIYVNWLFIGPLQCYWYSGVVK